MRRIQHNDSISPMMYKLLGLLLCFLTVSTVTYSQSDKPIDEEPKERTVFEIRNEGGNKYFKVLSELKNLESDDRMQQAMSQAVQASVAAFMAPNAEYENQLKQVRHRFRADSLATKIQQGGLFGLPKVKKEIASIIQDESLVMINEHHYFATHRDMVHQLLPLFKEAGFKYLALEALAHGQDSLLSSGHPPTIETGFYTKDPRFANLIRSAQAMDFIFVAYENTDRDLDREEGQAKNLYESTFEQDPEAKVLVLAGMDHILEHPTSRGKKWLAAVMQEKYGLDPLTINQNHLKYFQNQTEYAALIPASVFSNPVLQSVDYHLINNLPLEVTNPDYQFKNPYQHQVQLSLFLTEEYSDNTNYDQLIPYHSVLMEASGQAGFKVPDTDQELYHILYDNNGQILKEGPLTPQ